MKHIHFIIFFGVLFMSCDSMYHISELTKTVSEKSSEPKKIIQTPGNNFTKKRKIFPLSRVDFIQIKGSATEYPADFEQK